MIARVASFCRRLGHARSGVAMIEFAYSLPLLVLLAIGGTEVANLAITVLRVNQLAMMAADNVARVRGSIDENDINEVMIGLRFAGDSIGFGKNGRVIISSLSPNGMSGSNKGFTINWQRCFGAADFTSSYGNTGDGATNASLAGGMGPPGHKISPVDNSSLAFAEVHYTYQPLVAPEFIAARDIKAVQAFTVRDRASETLTNNQSLPDSDKRLCDAAHRSAT